MTKFQCKVTKKTQHGKKNVCHEKICVTLHIEKHRQALNIGRAYAIVFMEVEVIHYLHKLYNLHKNVAAAPKEKRLHKRVQPFGETLTTNFISSVQLLFVRFPSEPLRW